MTNNQDYFNRLTVLDTLLQIITMVMVSNDATNNDLMNELQKQNKEYLEQILENQKEMLKILDMQSNSPTQADYSTGQAQCLPCIDFKEVKYYGM